MQAVDVRLMFLPPRHGCASTKQFVSPECANFWISQCQVLRLPVITWKSAETLTAAALLLTAKCLNSLWFGGVGVRKFGSVCVFGFNFGKTEIGIRVTDSSPDATLWWIWFFFSLLRQRSVLFGALFFLVCVRSASPQLCEITEGGGRRRMKEKGGNETRNKDTLTCRSSTFF